MSSQKFQNSNTIYVLILHHQIDWNLLNFEGFGLIWWCLVQGFWRNSEFFWKNFSQRYYVSNICLKYSIFFGGKIRLVCIIRWGKNDLVFESNLNKIHVLNIIKSIKNHPNFKHFWDHLKINLIEVFMNYFFRKEA